QKPFCKKVFCGAFFQKRSAVPTAKLGRYAPTGKLGHSDIQFEAEYPDGVIKKHPTIDNNRRAYFF
ncbi:MAG: hypothetical protein IJD73_02970, partial [Clostridia bacterium]|nr:hypothetical protein [Clostridia bacterium]